MRLRLLLAVALLALGAVAVARAQDVEEAPAALEVEAEAEVESQVEASAEETAQVDVRYRDADYWPQPHIACDPLNIVPPPSVEFISCTLVAQARKSFAVPGSDFTHGACLDANARQSSADHPFMAGLGSCEQSDSLEFLYDPRTKTLLAGEIGRASCRERV